MNDPTYKDEANDALELDATSSEKLKAAYDAMDPTPEQEERMLAALLEAQATGEGEAGADNAETVAAEGMATETAGADASNAEAATADGSPSAEDELAEPSGASSENAPSPAPKIAKSGGFRFWKAALPLAACLVVGAIVIGVGNQQAASPVHEAAQSSASSPTATTADSTSERDNALMNAQPEMESTTEEAEGAMMYGMAQEYAMDDGALTADGYYDDTIDIAPNDKFNTEEYNAVEERGFTSTKSSPLSTVSADVDTASYCNLRRMINDGMKLSDIPAGSIRIEEMLNYFDYGYSSPTGDDKFSMQAQSAPCPWNSDTQLLVMGFATAPESQAASKGSNLVFLIDVSGSMDNPDKLDLLQDSFATLLENLGPNDRVSIVTYASGEEIVLEGASGDDDKAILKAIYKLHANGSTNGEAGLKQAYEVAQRNFIEGGVNRIIMASDGDLNVGISSESELHDFVDAKRETGVYLSVLGFGSGNYKDNKMEALADHGNGSYHYIDCIEEAERVLRDKLTANLVPFADNVKVQVEFNPAQVKAYRLIGYENRAIADEDFRDDSVDAGDVGPNSQFTVAYEIVPADSKMEIAEPELKYGNSQSAQYANGSSDWLTCTMRYHIFDGNEMREQQMTVDSGNVMESPSDDWNFAAAVIEFGMLARDSKYAGTSSTDSVIDLLGTNLNDERDGFKRLVVKAS